VADAFQGNRDRSVLESRLLEHPEVSEPIIVEEGAGHR
jgi:hypothetical protein